MCMGLVKDARASVNYTLTINVYGWQRREFFARTQWWLVKKIKILDRPESEWTARELCDRVGGWRTVGRVSGVGETSLIERCMCMKGCVDRECLRRKMEFVPFVSTEFALPPPLLSSSSSRIATRKRFVGGAAGVKLNVKTFRRLAFQGHVFHLSGNGPQTNVDVNRLRRSREINKYNFVERKKEKKKIETPHPSARSTSQSYTVCSYWKNKNKCCRIESPSSSHLMPAFAVSQTT